MLVTGVCALLAVMSPVLLPKAFRGFRDGGLLFLGLALLCSTWNAVAVGSLQLGDVFLLLALMAMLLTARGRRIWLPVPLVVGIALIILAGILTLLFPPSANYLSDQYQVPNALAQYGTKASGAASNLGELAKYLVALIGLPIAVVLARPNLKQIRLLAACWCLSGVINAASSLTDQAHITSFTLSLLGFASYDGRQAGLTVQPNHLAFVCVLTFPVMLVVFRSKLLRLAFTAVLIGGTIVSGSRGGLLGLVVAGVLLWTFTAGHRLLPFITTEGILVGILVALGFKGYLGGNIGSSRSMSSIEGSDVERSNAFHQAVLDFKHNPLHGIGYSQLNNAHEVHLQLLASGGVLALTGFVIYMMGVLAVGVKQIKVDRLASGLMAATVTWLLLNFTENQVADRYLYVPAALLIGLASSRRSESHSRLSSQTAPASSLSSQQSLSPEGCK